MIELAKTGRWLGGETPTGYNSEKYELVNVYEENEYNTVEKKKKKACKLVENLEEIHLIDIIAEKYLELKSLRSLETYLMQHDIVSRTGVYFSTRETIRGMYNPQNIYNTDIHYEIADWALAGNRLNEIGECLWYLNPFRPTCGSTFPTNGSGELHTRLGKHCFYRPTSLYAQT